jgi:hypothetical protein
VPGGDRRDSDGGPAVQERGLIERMHTARIAGDEHTFVPPGRPVNPAPQLAGGPFPMPPFPRVQTPRHHAAPARAGQEPWRSIAPSRRGVAIQGRLSRSVSPDRPPVSADGHGGLA